MSELDTKIQGIQAAIDEAKCLQDEPGGAEKNVESAEMEDQEAS